MQSFGCNNMFLWNIWYVTSNVCFYKDNKVTQAVTINNIAVVKSLLSTRLQTFPHRPNKTTRDSYLSIVEWALCLMEHNWCTVSAKFSSYIWTCYSNFLMLSFIGIHLGLHVVEYIYLLT